MMIYPTASSKIYLEDSTSFIDPAFFAAWFAGLLPGRYVSAELCKAFKQSCASAGIPSPTSRAINAMLKANGCTFSKSNGTRLTFPPKGHLGA